MSDDPNACPWGVKPQGDHHPGEPCILATDHLGPCVAAPERRRQHRTRGITGIAIRCPQCGAPVGQPCDLSAPDDPEPRVHTKRRVGRLAVRCITCGADPGEPCIASTTYPLFPEAPPEDTMRVRTVCTCGGALDVSGRPADVEAIRSVFSALHTGPGHTRTPPPRED